MITILIPYKSVLAIPMLCIPPTDEGKRAQSRESEEEEQRFYSALVAEHAQLKKRQKKRRENRSNRSDLFSQGIQSYNHSRICCVLSAGVEGLLLHISTTHFMCTPPPLSEYS